MERVKNYVAHDMVIISYFVFVLAYCLSCVISYIYIYIYTVLVTMGFYSYKYVKISLVP